MKSFCLLICFALLLTAASAQRIVVPKTSRAVLLDGRFSAKEWQGAHVIHVNDSLELHLKQDRDYFYWCLRDRSGHLSGVDFYMAFRDTILNLHASAKLGERIWQDGSYGEWTWWNHRQWSANVARFNSFEGQRFLQDEAKEFQLEKSRIADSGFRLMFQLDQPGERPPAYPSGARPETPERWLSLALKKTTASDRIGPRKQRSQSGGRNRAD